MRKLLLFSMLGLQLQVFAQISSGGIPPSFKFGLPINPLVYEMPHIPDTIAAHKQKALTNSTSKVLDYGYNFATQIAVPGNAEWIATPDGNEFCDILVRSTDALSLSLELGNIQLLEGEKIYLFDRNYNQILGAFTLENNNESNILPMAEIDGNELILEYVKPKTTGINSFNIIGVVHAFNMSHNKSTKACPGYNCACNATNINCPEGEFWQKEKNAVVKINMNGTICTATLINNILNDGRPFLLTAKHCFDSNPPTSLKAIFNYESIGCVNITKPAEVTMSGSVYRVYDLPKFDACLVELNQTIPTNYSPYFAGWSLDTINIQNTTVIHHPAGDIKKISQDNDSPVKITYNGDSYRWNLPLSYWNIVKWDLGITEGGSSGSALFNQNHLIIGALTGGGSDCSTQYDDNFYMFSRAYDYYSQPDKQFKYWLNPTNADINELQGIDLYGIYYASCDTISNIINSELKSTVAPNTGTGYLTGQNSMLTDSYAEKFENNSLTYISGAYFNVAVNKFSSGTKIEFRVWEGATEPTTVLYEEVINASNFNQGEGNLIKIKGNKSTSTNIFVGYKIFYNSTDTFAVNMVKNRVSSVNTAYVYKNSAWELLSNYNSGNVTSLDIKLIKNSKVNPEKIRPVSKTNTLQLYPNPASNYAHITSQTKISNIELISLLGISIPVSYQLSDKGAVLNIATLPNGTYFVKVASGSGTSVLRLIVKK